LHSIVFLGALPCANARYIIIKNKASTGNRLGSVALCGAAQPFAPAGWAEGVQGWNPGIFLFHISFDVKRNMVRAWG